MEEFKYLRDLFTSEGEMEWEIDRQIGAAADVEPVSCGEEKAELEGEALNLPINLHSNPHLW